MKITKPTHVYIAREKCGCVTGVVNDDADIFTANCVANFIASGRSIERVEWSTYVEAVSRESGFMNCKHGQLKLEVG